MVAEGLEKEEEEEEAVAVEVTTGGEQNKDSLLVAAFGWVSRNCLHWLSSREVLCFHSAQVSRPASRFRELRYGPCSASGKGHKTESVI